MSLVTRAGKGSELSWAEMDENFNFLSRNSISGALAGETASRTLAASDAGKTLYTNNTYPITLTLPLSAGVSQSVITLINIQSGVLTIAAQGSDGIYALGKQGVTNITILQGGFVQLKNDGASWIQVAGIKAHSSGTWTPVLAQTGMTIGQTVSGSYTRIGDIVTCNFSISISSLSGTPSGGVVISGLPFQVGASVGASGAARENAIAGLLWSLHASAGNSSIDVFRYDNGTTLVNGMQWDFTFVYRAA